MENYFKLKEDRFRLDIRYNILDIRNKKFFTVRDWHRLSRVKGAPFLKTFEGRLDGALRYLLYLKCPCLQKGAWN